MLILLIRTIIIYIFLLITMRLMGKRQLGELEVSELVSTLLLSDIAALPITNQEIPLTYALVPILAITTFEVTSSLLLTKVPCLKNLLSTRPSMVICRGRINRRELLKNRISVEELISELRQKDITDIGDVAYAIIEQNGRLTVIPRAACMTPTREELNIQAPEAGLCHILISDGTIDRHGLRITKKNAAWLEKQLKAVNKQAEDIFLMTLNDAGQLRIIGKDQIIGGQK